MVWNVERNVPPKYYDQYEHMKCPQARYQARQARHQVRKSNMVQADSVPMYNKFAKLAHKQSRRDNLVIKTNRLGRVQNNETMDYHYQVPTSNRFATLGDFFPGNY